MEFNNNLTWGGQLYETPSVTVLDIQVEGVLCESGDVDNPGNGYGNNNMGDI